MSNIKTYISECDKSAVWISSVAMKSGDEIRFHGPQFNNPKDKDEIKKLKYELAETTKKLEDIENKLDDYHRLEYAVRNLLFDIYARHPGEELRCPYMIELAKCLKKVNQ